MPSPAIENLLTGGPGRLPVAEAAETTVKAKEKDCGALPQDCL